RQGPQVILMCVGEDDPGERLTLVLDEGWVGKHHVDAGLGFIAELDPQVDHQPFARLGITGAIEIAVHPDLAGAAEREEDKLALLRGISGGVHVLRSRKASISANATSPP